MNGGRPESSASRVTSRSRSFVSSSGSSSSGVDSSRSIELRLPGERRRKRRLADNDAL